MNLQRRKGRVAPSQNMMRLSAETGIPAGDSKIASHLESFIFHNTLLLVMVGEKQFSSAKCSAMQSQGEQRVVCAGCHYAHIIKSKGSFPLFLMPPCWLPIAVSTSCTSLFLRQEIMGFNVCFLPFSAGPRWLHHQDDPHENVSSVHEREHEHELSSLFLCIAYSNCSGHRNWNR